MKNPNYSHTSLEAFLATPRQKHKDIIFALFKYNVTAQLSYKDVRQVLLQYQIDISLATITGRLNDLFREHLIKVTKIENGMKHYSLRLKDDQMNKFKMTWKEKFEEIEKMVLYAHDKKKYKLITTKSLILAIENLKDK